MADKYTKAVLTVIAVALSVIALQGGLPSASAQLGAGNRGCGDRNSPCYITMDDVRRLRVNVMNSPLEVHVENAADFRRRRR